MGIQNNSQALNPRYRRRHSLPLFVHADNNEWVDKAKNLMKTTGAEDISSTTEESFAILQRTEPQWIAKREVNI